MQLQEKSRLKLMPNSTPKQLEAFEKIQLELEVSESFLRRVINQRPHLLSMPTNRFIRAILNTLGANLSERQSEVLLKMPNLETMLRARRKIKNNVNKQ